MENTEHPRKTTSNRTTRIPTNARALVQHIRKKVLNQLTISSSDSSSFSSAFSSSLGAAATGATSATGARAANASGLARYSFTYDNNQQIHSGFKYRTSHLGRKIDNASLRCSEFSVYTTNHMGQPLTDSVRQEKELTFSEPSKVYSVAKEMAMRFL